MEFASWPHYSLEEADAVRDVLLSNKVNYWTGSLTTEFERKFANKFEIDFAIAVSNGTVALDLALVALGIRAGDEVIVTPRTYIASVSSIINSGATPVFADVDLATQNICPQSVSRLITKKTKAILCVHLAGRPCPMDEICHIADEYDLCVIEDCAQAHGAYYKGKAVGSFGDISCWSFCQDKIMSTGGEGGMVGTKCEELWAKMWSYKDHGKHHRLSKRSGNSQLPTFQWVHDSFGTNWRLTEMQSAIGLIQLSKLDDWSQARLSNAEKIWDCARRKEFFFVPDWKCPDCSSAKTSNSMCCHHAAYKAYLFVKGDGNLRDSLISKLRTKKVPVASGICPEVYLEGAFENTGLRPQVRLPNAKKLGETSIMFLCHPTLSREAIDYTCECISSL